MHRHRRKIFIGIALAFVFLIWIKLATIGDDPKKEVEAYKKSLIAKGEKLEISELIPPPIPQEQNGADIVNEAFSMMTPEDDDESNFIPAMQMISPGKAIVCFEQPDIRGWYFTNSWVNAAAAIEDDQPMAELLKQAMNYPVIDFQIDFREPFEIFNTRTKNARYFMDSTRRLSAAAVYDLHRGNPAQAATNICIILAFANGLQEERFLTFQLVRILMTKIGADTSWELLQSDKLDDPELACVQSSWERLEFVRPMETALSMSRAYSEYEVAKMLSSNEYLDKRTSWARPSSVDWSEGLSSGLNQIAENARVHVCRAMYHGSWIYSNELQMLQNYQDMLEMIRTAETNRVFNPAYRNMVNQLKVRQSKRPGDFLASLDKYGFHNLISEWQEPDGPVGRTMEVEAIQRIVITAIALKRYQLKHGSYPATLSDLAPEFVSAVLQDPVDGKPLRYRLISNEIFLLYSIGENGRDDGGDGSLKAGLPYYFPNWTDGNALDWVWPQPATASEIQDFYAHPAGP